MVMYPCLRVDIYLSDGWLLRTYIAGVFDLTCRSGKVRRVKPRALESFTIETYFNCVDTEAWIP